MSSDEFLNYAEANYKEWELKGNDMVARYMKNYERDFQKRNDTTTKTVVSSSSGGGTTTDDSSKSSTVVKFADDE